ncbi:MAG: hypothetical protein WDM81_21180 [Rhizomicrobium sp.]
MRPHWPDVWAALSEADKRRVLRHGLSAFNTHRHRVAPHQGRQMADAVADGRVEILRGRLVTLTPRCNSVLARIATPTGRIEAVFGRVVNCSGPNSDVERSPGTLLKTLIARGLARPGPANLGIGVDDSNRVLDQDGAAQQGPVRHGRADARHVVGNHRHAGDRPAGPPDCARRTRAKGSAVATPDRRFRWTYYICEIDFLHDGAAKDRRHVIASAHTRHSPGNRSA